MHRILLAVIVSSALLLSGCEKKPSPSNESGSTPPAVGAKNGAAPADKGGTDAAKGPGQGGDVIELGETSIDGMKVRTSRDAGEITPGGDSPIDIWIDGGLGSAAAVRFWIGSEDAKGSIKAKAAVEDGHWHTHGEVPDPIPPESKLWVEIEGKDGKKSIASFDLKRSLP